MSDSPIILLQGVRIFQRENLILNNVDFTCTRASSST